MKPENEKHAAMVLVLLRKAPATIEELAEQLRDFEGRTKYVITQMVKKKRVVKLDGHRYGDPARISATTPPPSFRSERR